MAKIIDPCWLSPLGEVFWCSSHVNMANELIDEFYPLEEVGPDCGFSVEEFLIKKGWIKYYNHSWCQLRGWAILPSQRLTKRQKDAIFELTEVYIEDGGEVHFASPFLYYNYIFSFAKVTYSP